MEILIAVAVLATTLTAMATLVIVTMRANQSNINTLGAYYLAEQGVEAMRNVRDSNWLQNYSWNKGFSCTSDGEEIYLTIDEDVAAQVPFLTFDGSRVIGTGVIFGSLISSISSNDDPWDINVISSTDLEAGTKIYKVFEPEGYYRYTHDDSEGSATDFYRYIKIYYETCDGGAEVSSVVFWNERGNDREVVLTTYLTNWKQ